MTALVFIAALIGFYFAPRYPLEEWQLALGVEATRYELLYAATGLSAFGWAVVATYRRNDFRIAMAAAVLTLYWALCYPAWGSSNPLLAHAFLSAAVAGYFVLGGVRRWELFIGGIFIASVVCGFAAWVGILATGAGRPSVYVALTAHPDWLSILGHMGSVALGAAAGDGGLRIRDYLGYRALGDPAGVRIVSRVYSLAKMATGQKGTG